VRYWSIIQLRQGGVNGYGEVDDVLAALSYLQTLDYVDSGHIYLGGHSTGGTLALLVAEYSARFRAVFSFGPVSEVLAYGAASGFIPYDRSLPEESKLRSPIHWLSSVKSPVWVFEGSKGNILDLRGMAGAVKNPNLHFIEINGASHFSGLAPTTELLARKILQDSGAGIGLTITNDEVTQNFNLRVE